MTAHRGRIIEINGPTATVREGSTGHRITIRLATGGRVGHGNSVVRGGGRDRFPPQGTPIIFETSPERPLTSVPPFHDAKSWAPLEE